MPYIKASAQLQYPESIKGQQVDKYYGNEVPDPYRWLENKNGETTREWVKKQNEFTAGYLSQIPFRTELLNKLTTLQNYTRYADPFIAGDYYYFYKNDGLQEQNVLYRQKGLKGEPEIFLDPNTLSPDGSVALTNVSFNNNATLCAFTTSKKGSEWNEAFVMEVKTKKVLNDHVEWIKFSKPAWHSDEGFYYSRYPEAENKQNKNSPDQFHTVYYHAIGTDQSADVIAFEDPEHPFRYHFAEVTEDDRYLIINVSEGTANMQILLKDLSDGRKAKFKTIVEGFKYETQVIDSDKKFLYLRTNVSAPNFRIVAANIANPYANNWETMVAEKKEVLQTVQKAGGHWFSTYLKDANSRLVDYQAGGYFVKEIDIPALSTVKIMAGNSGDNDFMYSYSSFTVPTVLCRYHISNGKSSIFKESELNFNPADYETKQVFFTNRDRVKIPLYISYKKTVSPTAQNPLLLSGYGGFNIAQTPGFNVSNLFFMSQGGIFVQACVRGGSEYGEAWHNAGMGYKKQNVINDFIDAASYLIKEKYTSAEKLAITGNGNGGLLVGGSLVQRPELFKVALPDAGVFDMLRYQKFNTGVGWLTEYGSSDEVEEFDNLYSYSPLHNVKPGKSYPATLITASANDENVVPMHSYKFAARLQECQGSSDPILLRVDNNTAPGELKPTGSKIDKLADVMSFTLYQLGMELK